MLWILFIAATLLWGLAYAVGYARGQTDLKIRQRVLQWLAEERRKNGSFLN
jgi:hypothetical protein